MRLDEFLARYNVGAHEGREYRISELGEFADPDGW